MPSLTSVTQHSARNSSNRQEKEIGVIQIGKEEIKQSPFAINMIVYIENAKESAETKQNKPLRMNEFDKVTEYEIHI